MPYCPKCGSEVKEENSFCPKCGAALKATGSTPPRSPEYRRNEKAEKNEKQEKNEKSGNEKYEKQQFGVFGPFMGGVILILVGLMFYLSVSGIIEFRSIFPFVLIIIGALIIIGVLTGAMRAKQRNPKP
ncbi:MAG: zinc-ribbon domain-containing protein [Candidatus Bathyarchaeota archaeon]|nr:MAG: zinc-ribbon domain-containing protein [Candidatus Bathyarchaeota archaeon]